MSQVSNKNFIQYLDIDIIEYILNFTFICCHTCKKKYSINFFTKLGNFYYCCKECYNHI